MPIVEFENVKIPCENGEYLSQVIKRSKKSLYNGPASYLNCHGLGTCGTCTVRILEGEVTEMGKIEQARLNFAPHSLESGLRMACQVKVLTDLKVVKHEGFWGHLPEIR